jgi:hypothetical protein
MLEIPAHPTCLLFAVYKRASKVSINEFKIWWQQQSERARIVNLCVGFLPLIVVFMPHTSASNCGCLFGNMEEIKVVGYLKHLSRHSSEGS